MNSRKQTFVNWLDDGNQVYYDDDEWIDIPFKHEELDIIYSIRVWFIEGSVHLLSLPIQGIRTNRLDSAISLCNKLNNESDMVRFSITEDNQLAIQSGAYLSNRKQDIIDVCSAHIANILEAVDAVAPAFYELTAPDFN